MNNAMGGHESLKGLGGVLTSFINIKSMNRNTN